MADGFVELLVLLGGDVFFGARPQRAGFVDRLPLAGFDHAAGLAATVFVAGGDQFAVLPLFLFHQDGQADVVRVFGNDGLEFPRVQVVVRVIAQVQRDAGAARGALDGFDLKVARAGADPAHAFAGGHAGAARFDGDFVGDDKARIKADAKLANQLSVLLLVAGQLAHKVFGAALGDGAEVVNRLLRRHADAVVGDGDGFGRRVKRHAHFEVGRVFVQLGLVQRFKTQLVASVRGVGDQLAGKNFGIGIQRVRDQMQQLGDFGLEGKGLFAHGAQ